MKKKVLQLFHGFSMGGAETLVKEYCLKINRENYDISVLCFYKYDTPYEKLLEAAGVQITYIDSFQKRSGRTGVKKLANIYEVIKRYFFIRKYIKQEKPDIVHTHLTVNSYIDFANPRKNTRIVHTVHNEPKRLWKNTFLRKLDFLSAKRLVKKYNMQFVVLHEEMKKEVNELFHVDNSIVLNNGIDFSRFSNAEKKELVRRKIGIPENAYVIGHVGRFSSQKNHKFLVEIFSEINKKNDKAFLLLIGNGTMKAEIENKIRKMKLDNKCMILSNRGDVPDLLNAMDKFVFPSFYEGLPVTLIEVQKMGLKCVVSDAISDSVVVSNLVKKVSLDKTAEEWADEVLQFQVDVPEYFDIEKWDMTQVVRKLETIYGE